MMKVCKKCGKETPDNAKHRLCDECRKGRWDKIKKGLKITSIVAGATAAAYVAGKLVISQKSRTESHFDGQEFDDVYTDMDTCDNCEHSLSNCDRSLPWEDGNNAHAYIRCRHCGYKNIRYGFGEDD